MVLTGHVTAGGSICIEALVNTGSPNGWQPSYTFESIISLVICNMVDCETAVVKTLSGPGGVSGPLRVDLVGQFHGGPQSVMREYGEAEAQAAYSRMVDNHKRLGWTTSDTSPSTTGPAAASSSAPYTRTQMAPPPRPVHRPPPSLPPPPIASLYATSLAYATSVFNNTTAPLPTAAAAAPGSGNPGNPGNPLPSLTPFPGNPGNPLQSLAPFPSRPPSPAQALGPASDPRGSSKADEGAYGSMSGPPYDTINLVPGNNPGNNLMPTEGSRTVIKRRSMSMALGRPPSMNAPLGRSSSQVMGQSSSSLMHQDLTRDSDDEENDHLEDEKRSRGSKRRRKAGPPSDPNIVGIYHQVVPGPDGITNGAVAGGGKAVNKVESIVLLDSQDDDVQLLGSQGDRNAPLPSQGLNPPLSSKPTSHSSKVDPLIDDEDQVIVAELLGPAPNATAGAAAAPLVPRLKPNAFIQPMVIVDDDDDEVEIVSSRMIEKKGESVSDLQKKIHALERANRFKEQELERAKRAAEAAAEAAKQLSASSLVAGALGHRQGTAQPLVPPRIPPPSHWEPFPPGHPEDSPLFVQLPLHFDDQGGDDEGDNAEEEDHPSLPEVDESLVEELVGNGINAEDARAALGHCSGDLIKACEFVSDCRSRGGASAVVHRINEQKVAEAQAAKLALGGGVRRSGGQDSVAQAAQRAQAEAEALLKRQHRAKMAAVKGEVEMIRVLFEESSTLSSTHAIVAIERVQNRQLYTDYSLRKAKLEAQVSGAAGSSSSNQLQADIGREAFVRTAVAAGYSTAAAHQLATMSYPLGQTRSRGRGPANEKFLWHGSSLEIIKTVCSEGFDFRVSNQAGVLGMGTYYSEDAHYSSQYSMRHQASTAALLMTQMAAGRVLAAPMAMPAPPPMPTVAQALQSQVQALKQSMQAHAVKASRGRAPKGIKGGPASSTSQPYPAAATAPGPAPRPRQRIVASPTPTFKGHSMLLCQVALGRTTAGSAGLRRPPPGHDAVHGHSGYPNAMNYAIFDNSQAYPSFLVHFAPK